MCIMESKKIIKTVLSVIPIVLLVMIIFNIISRPILMPYFYISVSCLFFANAFYHFKEDKKMLTVLSGLIGVVFILLTLLVIIL